MKNIAIAHYLLSLCGILLSFQAMPQSRDSIFDKPIFYESEYTSEMVYIKWYAAGLNPATDFIPLRYENDQPVVVESPKMTYVLNDTTFYVLQDTTAPKILPDQLLQYFIAPVDTTGQTAQSSDIVIITGHDTRTAWFAETHILTLENENGIRVSWKYKSPGSVSRYDIYRSLFADKDFLLLASVAATDTSYDDRETIPDLVYYYQIMAIPLTQNKPIASNLIFGTSYNPQPPIPPYISMANGIGGGAVLHIHATDTEAKGVRIYRDNGSTPELYVVSDLIPVNDTLAIVYYDTLSMLSGKRTYTYAAKTESTSFVESEFSNRVYVRPRITTPPDVPVSLTSYEEDRQVLLFWEDVEARDAAIAGYRIFRKEVADSVDNPFIALLPDDTIWLLNHYTDTTTLPGKVYMYKVQSVDIDNNMSHQAIVTTVATQRNMPISPFALRAHPTEEGIYLMWSQTIYPDIASVQLYRKHDGAQPMLLATLPPEAEDYTDNTAISDSTFYYYLTTTNKDGIESAPSEEVAVTF